MLAYISGPLVSSRNLDDARFFYSFLGEICRNCGLNPYIPHNHTDPVAYPDLSPIEVFDKDFEALVRSEMIIAYIGRPSLGVGAELGIAFQLGKPVIALHESEEKPSRFVLGMLRKAKSCQIITFKDNNECGRKLSSILSNFKRQYY